jgi:Protein of unknown function (DUF3592)
MSKLFHLLAAALSAWQQAGLLLAGSFLAGLGALLLGNRIYWRLRAVRVSGKVIGVREAEKRTYYPVYRYTLPKGGRIEAASVTGRNWTSGMETGRSVPLLVFEQHPDNVAEADSRLVEIIGGILTAVGAAILYVALTAWPVTSITWLMLTGISVYLASRALKSILARSAWTPGLALGTARPENLHEVPVRPVEEIRAERRIELQHKQWKTGRIVTPILVLVGISVLALGVYLGRTISFLQSHGRRAQGAVVGLELEATLHSSSYYPVVRFVTPDGAVVQFRDSSGSNPPSYHEGEPVSVLYLHDSPEQSAMIDRGWWNWLAPVALCLVGTILALVALRVRLGSRPAPGAANGAR